MENRILIVDDEIEICSLLAKRLAKEGYSCVTANNGREALNHFYTDNFSLIISDIRMPEMDGMELLNTVKSLNPYMTVIIMTAYPEINKAVEASRLGAYKKPGPLTFEEYRHIQEHPLIGIKILEGIEFFQKIIPMIRHHHEHFDGRGYPDGLVGEAIPLEARIIAVSDAFDAMTSVRPHRDAMPLEGALKELIKGKGKQFDPHILEIFLREKLYDMAH